MIQYRIIRIKDGALLGYIVGKTLINGDRYLIYQAGTKTEKIKITQAMERLYRVEAVQVG